MKETEIKRIRGLNRRQHDFVQDYAVKFLVLCFKCDLYTKTKNKTTTCFHIAQQTHTHEKHIRESSWNEERNLSYTIYILLLTNVIPNNGNR